MPCKCDVSSQSIIGRPGPRQPCPTSPCSCIWGPIKQCLARWSHDPRGNKALHSPFGWCSFCLWSWREELNASEKVIPPSDLFLLLVFLCCGRHDPAVTKPKRPDEPPNHQLCFCSTFTSQYTFSLSSSLQTSPVRTTPYTHLLLTTLRGPANTLISVEGNIWLCNDHKEGWPGQRWGRPLTPSEPAECAGDHGAADELSDESWTVHLGDLWCHSPDSRRMCL